MLFLLPITLSSPLQPWKTQTHGSFLCIPTLDLLPVCPSHLVHAHHMVTLYSVCSIYCQPLHLLACPCPECSFLIHFYLCYVGLAHSRCSGNGYSTHALMHTFVRTLWRPTGLQGEVQQLVPDECTVSLWLHLAVKQTGRAFEVLDSCSSALIISSWCLAPGTLLDTLT